MLGRGLCLVSGRFGGVTTAAGKMHDGAMREACDRLVTGLGEAWERLSEAWVKAERGLWEA